MDITTFSEAVIVPIVVAGITAGSSVIAVILSTKKNMKKATDETAKLREENTSQHNDNKAIIEHISRQVTGIDTKVDKLDDRLDGVQLWQANHEKLHLQSDIDER